MDNVTETTPLSPAQKDRLFVGDMWTNQASWKAKGWKPYYLSDGQLHVITVNRCRNKWGVIYLLTEQEVANYNLNASSFARLKEVIWNQLTALNELAASHLVHNIIKP